MPQPGGPGPGLVRSFSRTGVALLAAGAVTLLPFLAAGTGTAGADSSFVLGTADAVGQAVTIHPSTSGLGYDITLATSIADYQGNEGQAESQTLNLGSIGLALTTTQCDGSAPDIKQSQLPQPAESEATTGDAAQSASLSPSGFPGGTGAGVEQTTATPAPAAGATTTLTAFDIAQEVDVDGVASSASAEVTGGQTRAATATADIASVSLLGGLVVLKGLHWSAAQSSGAQTAATGTFSVASVTVAGQSLPTATPDQLTSTLNAVDAAIAPTGLHLLPPFAAQEPDGTEAESPLVVGIDNSALGRQAVGPVLGAAEPLTSAIDNALLGQSCKYGTELLLGDIALGALAGGGGLDLELGGVHAVTNDTTYADPFGAAGAAPLSTGGSDAGALPTTGVGTGPITSFTPGLPGTPGIPATAGTPGGAGATTSTTAAHPAAVATTTRTSLAACRSQAGGGCASGAALAGGLVGLGVAGTVAGMDVRRLRRRRQPAFPTFAPPAQPPGAP